MNDSLSPPNYQSLSLFYKLQITIILGLQKAEKRKTACKNDQYLAGHDDVIYLATKTPLNQVKLMKAYSLFKKHSLQIITHLCNSAAICWPQKYLMFAEMG